MRRRSSNGRKIEKLLISPDLEDYLRQEAILRSAVSSARIEGNPLTIAEARSLLRETLLPRRKEILEIIKDHPFCSFDFIFRRFSAVNPKTLHYDLLRLQKEGFIQKVGKTRGSRYRIKS